MLGNERSLISFTQPDKDKKLTLEIKMRAIHGLGYLGDKSSIEPLINFYKEEKSDDLRTYAIMALGFILDGDKVNPLYKITADNNFCRAASYFRAYFLQ